MPRKKKIIIKKIKELRKPISQMTDDRDGWSNISMEVIIENTGKRNRYLMKMKLMKMICCSFVVILLGLKKMLS